jgi:hypothetical protein
MIVICPWWPWCYLKCADLMKGYSKTTNGIITSNGLLTWSTCISNGLFLITTLSECNAAAAAIGNADTSVDTDKTTRCFGNCHEGCYEYDDKLRLNTRKYVRIGAYGSRFPICRTNEMPCTKF